MVKRQYLKWKSYEVEFFREHYGPDGVKFCADILCRPITSITSKAKLLGLRTSRRRRRIVKYISKHKVIAECYRHGEVLHYYGYCGESLQCSLCTKDSHAKWRRSDPGKKTRSMYQRHKKNDPLFNYATRLRSRINYYRSIGRLANTDGCFRYLPFTPKQLADYLEVIRINQGNCCPNCDANYDVVGFHIDHVVPLSTAESEENIWVLFNLSNLSLLCPTCNCRKGDRIDERSFYSNEFHVL